MTDHPHAAPFPTAPAPVAGTLPQSLFAPLSRSAAPALTIAQTGETLSYAELESRIVVRTAAFAAGRGLLALVADNSADTIVTLLAAWRARCPVILLEGGSGRHLDRLRAVYPVRYLRAAGTTAVETLPDPEGAAESLVLHPDLALLLSTSGSTGEPKLVRLSARNMQSNAEAIATYLAITPADRAPTMLPIGYSYGLSVVTSYLAAGASLLVTDRSVMDPDFWATFEQHRCTSLTGVPKTFDLIEQGGWLDRPYPALRYVTQAGGRLAPGHVAALARRGARTGWAFYVMYGQTEAAPRIAYLPPDLAAQHPESIGRAIPGGQLVIVDDAGREITTPGVEGEIVYRGPNVMMGYATSPTDLARGAEVAALHTGDMGRCDEEGLFYVTGRRARFVKLAGKRVGLDAVETWVEAGGRAAIVTGRDDLIGVVIQPDGGDPEALRGALAAHLDVPRIMVAVTVADVFPLKPSGKPDYVAALSLIEAAQGTDRDPQDRSAEALQAQLYAAFAHQFPDREIGPQTSFSALGGTSNDFVDMEIELESILGTLPRNWQEYRIADLAAGDTASPSAARSVFDMHAARALACLLVIFIHVTGNSPTTGLLLPPDHYLYPFNTVFSFVRMPLFAFAAGASFALLDMPRLAPRRFAAAIGIGLVLPTLLTMTLYEMTLQIVQTPGHKPLAELWTVYVYPYVHFWFIEALLLMSAAFYTVMRYGGRLAIALVLAMAVAPVLIHGEFEHDVFAINEALELTPFFGLGIVFAGRADTIATRPWLIGAVVLTCIAVVALFGPGAEVQVGRPPPRVTDSILVGVAAVLLFVLAAGRLRFLRYLAPYTLPIYLWHKFGVEAADHAMVALEVDMLWLKIAAGFLAGIAVPFAVFEITRRLGLSRMVTGKA